MNLICEYCGKEWSEEEQKHNEGYWVEITRNSTKHWKDDRWFCDRRCYFYWRHYPEIGKLMMEE